MLPRVDGAGLNFLYAVISTYKTLESLNPVKPWASDGGGRV